jgi:hypothetical protein
MTNPSHLVILQFLRIVECQIGWKPQKTCVDENKEMGISQFSRIVDWRSMANSSAFSPRPKSARPDRDKGKVKERWPE